MKIASVTGYDELRLQLAAQYEEQLTAITQKGLSDRQKFQQLSSLQKVKTLLSEGVALTQGVAGTNKKLFEMNKSLALAEAAVTLPSAVLKAFEKGGGWPYGAVFATLTAAKGAAQIQAINSASFSGGGSAASVAPIIGGGTPVVPQSNQSIDNVQNNNPSQQQQSQTIIQVLPGAYVGDYEALKEGLRVLTDNEVIETSALVI